MSWLAPRCCRTPDLAASRGSPCPYRFGTEPLLDQHVLESRGDAPTCGRARRNPYPLYVPDSKLQVQTLHDHVMVRAVEVDDRAGRAWHRSLPVVPGMR